MNRKGILIKWLIAGAVFALVFGLIGYWLMEQAGEPDPWDQPWYPVLSKAEADAEAERIKVVDPRNDTGG